MKFPHIFLFLVIPSVLFSQVDMPMGFFKPNIAEETVLYLYAEESLNAKPGDKNPTDSITFKKLGYNIVMDHYPEWFEPVMEKLDYNIFYISVKKLGSSYVEIIANEETGKTTYVESHTGQFVTWEEFLLKMHSVEFASEGQKLFDNPMVKSAGKVYSQHTFFRPKYVQGDWMQVEVLGDDFEPTGQRGWLRWRKDNQLLIRYNLLS